jgi:hypothetical protein
MKYDEENSIKIWFGLNESFCGIAIDFVPL